MKKDEDCVHIMGVFPDKRPGRIIRPFSQTSVWKKALQYLQETDMKTYEISEQVGYNNVRRFVDAFKQRYGVSPMEYKKNMRSK